MVKNKGFDVSLKQGFIIDELCYLYNKDDDIIIIQVCGED